MQRVVAGNSIEQHRCILDGAAERADLVEGGSERDKAVTGNRTVGRLEADNAAEGRRLTDGTAGIRAKGERCFACRNDSSGAAGRAARYAVEVMRVVGRVHSRILAGGAHCELVHVGLAGDNRVGSRQLLDNGSVVGRLEVAQHLGRAGGQRALGADVVLDGDRDTGQSGKRIARSALLIDGLGLRERRLLSDGNVALNLVLYRLRACKNVLCQLDSGDLLLAEQFGQLGRSFLKKCHLFSVPSLLDYTRNCYAAALEVRCVRLDQLVRRDIPE